ncbi:hypothetical protein I4U23_016208 [Adineta vaga]|nr:hypothetical protein I4U23_016208 [Adineta vaga]
MYFFVDFLYCALLHWVTAFPQMNLYSTNELDANNSGIVFQHDCFHIPASVKKDSKTHLIIHYCLTEWPLEWTIEENSIDKKLTFADLYKQNITTEQLYLWSAPLDVMEHYEYYLNHLSNANQSAALAKQVFYNCTSPRFGTSCQYSFDSYIVKTNDSTLYEVIHEFYQQDYNPENLTCYMHLACNRGSKSICLDWSEICDGTVDCQDRVDEGSCWELKISHCAQDEYECANKQCISQSFLHDGPHSFECLDATDEYLKIRTNNFGLNQVVFGEPAFEEEDIICPIRYDSPSNLFRLTSSCTSKRNQLLGQLLFDSAPALISNDCWIAVICQLNIIQLPNQQCYSHCSGFTCSNIINHTCPDMINVPAGAVLFGHIFFVYTKQDLLDPLFRMLPPRYVCYNDQFCDGFYPNKSLLSFDTSTCRHPVDFPLDFGRPPPKHTWLNKYVLPLYQKLSHCNKINHNYSSSCNNVTMYQCMNSSKCIPKYRLCNFVADCDYSDDEQCSSINGSCLLYGLDDLFKCNTQNWCISPALVQDRECHCSTDEIGVCEDEQISLLYSRSQISFPTICDGFTELTPIIINGRNETDETECEYWQCNNTYTRCDGFWNCFNGADEVGCHALSTLLLFNCTDEYQHICVSPKTNQLTCLPLAKANDGRIDCAGGTDEPQLCRSLDHHPSFTNFYCRTNLGEYCVAYKHLCPLNNYEINADEKFCYTSPDMMQKRNIRKEAYGSRPSGVENFLCTREIDVKKPKIKYFSLGKLTDSIDQMALQQTNDMIFDSPIRQINAHQQRQRCQRGLPLQVWFNTKRNLSIETCLCPPSFYGNACQYQNQRVSLTLRIQTYSDSRRTVFTLIISLIDDSVERNIHSYHQLTYLYIRDCQTKFNIYLLYSSRPKNLTKNYSIHIDIYEKISWIYRGSYLVAINYPFLPVHRVAKELYIPRSRGNLQHCSDYQCVHGQRIKYVETSHDVCFCQCDSGWYGKYCTLSYVSGCSSDSRSIGITVTNRSICICPLHKWGSRCLLNNQICFANRTATCQNNGQCIPNDDSVSFGKEYSCICSQGFTGERCETEDNKLILSFHKDIVLPQTVLIHFIRVMDNGPPENGSTFKTILTYQNAITVRWSRPFHVAFLDLYNRNYYLVTVQKHYKPMSTVVRTINPIDRCEHISQVLNKTILELHPLRRIKYYQLPCEQHSPVLSCFYDDKHICLCSDHNHRRSTNCFEFNHHSEHTCLGQSTCEHGAHCVQDRAICPQTSVCIFSEHSIYL